MSFLDKFTQGFSQITNLFSNREVNSGENADGINKTEQTSFWAGIFGGKNTSTPQFNNRGLNFTAQQIKLSNEDIKANLLREARTQNTQVDNLPAPKTIIIPLKDGKKQAGYDELAYRVTKATLERNGIHPSNVEMEELMALPQSKNMDMNGWLDKKWRFHDLPGLMPEAVNSKDINGKEVFGYNQTLSPKFQKSVLDDYKRIKGELALTPDKKAVVDMSMNERLLETVKIAYDKGYISKEVKDKLGKLTPEELATAFALGGAVGIAATSAEASAVIGPLGLIAGESYIAVKAVEFEPIAKGAAAATNRDQLDKPAREFGEWMGNLSKDGVLALAGMAGGAVAPRAMPKVEPIFDWVYGGIKNTAAGESNLKLPVLGLPEHIPVTPGIPNPKLPVPLSGAPKPAGGRPIITKPNDSIIEGAPGVIVARPEPLEIRSPRGTDIGGSRAPVEGRGIPNRGNGAPEWNNASTPAKGDGKATGALKGHAGKHGGDRVLPPEAQAYYDQAVKNMNFGAKFEYTHGGQIKTGYITKINDKEYLFTGCSRNSKSIFTHYIMSKNELRNIGITLKQE